MLPSLRNLSSDTLDRIYSTMLYHVRAANHAREILWEHGRHYVFAFKDSKSPWSNRLMVIDKPIGAGSIIR
jgi:hypothetical protein